MISSSTAAITNSTHNNSIDEEDGLEVENAPLEEIRDPFNPEKIKIRTMNVVVALLVSRIDEGDIDLTPDFQREVGIWNPQRKSRLIESLLLRIPIPAFYVAASEDDNWSVVDGIQRITTICNYMKGEFDLRDLEYLNELKGLKYDELPRSMRRRIDETQLVVNVIEPGTPQEVMFNVFHRINTGGMPLNAQEIRNALNPGPVRDYLKDLSESKEFTTATNNSVSTIRMGDRECVLRFIAFYMEPWEEYADNSLDNYLVYAMRKVNKMSQQELDAIAKDFKRAMRAGFDIFGEEAFRKPRGENNRRRPVSRALFDSWSVQLARCSTEEIATLIGRRDDVQGRFRSLTEDAEFNNVISASTGTPARVRRRFQAIKELVEEVVSA